jgi:hypothetical protein
MSLSLLARGVELSMIAKAVALAARRKNFTMQSACGN